MSKIFSSVTAVFCAAGTMFFSSLANAQDIVRRCDGPSGKVTYAEVCPDGTMPSTVNAKGHSVTESDKRLREQEAAFQKRHAAREKVAASERAAQRRAAVAMQKNEIAQEKMRREMALKEDAAKRGERKVGKVSRKKKKSRNE